YTSDVLHFFQSPWTFDPAEEYLFSEQEILDDQLRMMFTCCHPSISSDSQIALILKTLCGFSIVEIAKAFLTNNENINKRLVRARKKIRDAKIHFEVPNVDKLGSRLKVVLEAIYLLFNEGYNASTGDDLIRLELCNEAIRLNELIINHQSIKNNSDAYALLALMQLNASRFKARQNDEGIILTLEQQDRSLWNQDLIKKGLANLERSANNKQISIYHILASISAYHCIDTDFKSTDWKSILALYDNLVRIDSSPIILLNRAVAFSKIEGAQKAIQELDKIKNDQIISSYYLFHSTIAEFYIQNNQFLNASESLERAIQLTSMQAEKKLLESRLTLCREKIILY
ncbi:MAG: DUF6596 domain-containing protein, partial [Ignavibacteriaceae bacterium]